MQPEMKRRTLVGCMPCNAAGNAYSLVAQVRFDKMLDLN